MDSRQFSAQTNTWILTACYRSGRNDAAQDPRTPLGHRPPAPSPPRWWRAPCQILIETWTPDIAARRSCCPSIRQGTNGGGSQKDETGILRCEDDAGLLDVRRRPDISDADAQLLCAIIAAICEMTSMNPENMRANMATATMARISFQKAKTSQQRAKPIRSARAPFTIAPDRCHRPA